MGLNLSTFNGAIKQLYASGSDVMVEQQNLNAPFLNSVKKLDLKVSDDGTFNAVVMKGNESIGSIFPGEAFAAPGTIDPQKARVKPRLFVAPIEVEGSAIRRSQSDKIAFAKAYDAEVKDTTARSMMDRERQFFGTGTGQISLANGAGAGSASLVVDDTTGFRVGMKIDAWTALGGTKEIDSVEITDVDISTNTLTLASVQTWTDNDIISKAGKLDGVTSVETAKEMTGWRAICDTTTFSTTFENISVTAYPQWKGNVVSAGNAPITDDFLRQTLNRIRTVSGKEPDKMISNFGQTRNFLAGELTKTRYEPGKVEAGNTVLKWGRYEWVENHNYPRYEIGLMNTDDIFKVENQAFGLADLPGYSMYQKYGYDAIGAYLVEDANFGTWRRHSHGRLTDLTEPTY